MNILKTESDNGLPKPREIIRLTPTFEEKIVHLNENGSSWVKYYKVKTGLTMDEFENFGRKSHGKTKDKNLGTVDTLSKVFKKFLALVLVFGNESQGGKESSGYPSMTAQNLSKLKPKRKSVSG